MPLFAPILGLLLAAPQADTHQPFAIEVIDAATRRGIPLVELTTVNHIRYVTDSNGLVAFDEPGLLGQTVFFHVKSPGYQFPADGFGIRGKALKTTPGGSARLELDRTNIAERLYRVTGQGIYRDTVKLGRDAPTKQPLLNAQVLGQDSVQSIVHNGKALWFWGDTNKPSYPLGNFHSPGATSPLPGSGGLDPALGVNLDYFLDDKTGFARPTAQMPGEGPTWISSLTHLPGPDCKPRLHAAYVKVRPGMSMEAYEHGLITWDDQEQVFKKTTVFPEKLPLYPEGHTFQHQADDGTTYVYFPRPYPHTRVKADFASFSDPAQYQSYTCLMPGSTPETPLIDRNEQGSIHYSWKTNAPPLSIDDQTRLIKSGLLKPEEALLCLRDVESGEPVRAHGSSIAWNPHRQAWIMICVQAYGKPSFLGEVWFAEAPAPEGPWCYACKIATHPDYSFYNPRHHPFLDQQDGRLIYFEGTYVTTFSGNDHPTPWYDYNQLMYRLDLDDPRLNLPTTVRLNPEEQDEVSFFTLPKPAPETLPLSQSPGGTLHVDVPVEGDTPLGYILPPSVSERPPGTLYLRISSNVQDGTYQLDTSPPSGPSPHSLGLVWENPTMIPLPPARKPSTAR